MERSNLEGGRLYSQMEGEGGRNITSTQISEVGESKGYACCTGIRVCSGMMDPANSYFRKDESCECEPTPENVEQPSENSTVCVCVCVCVCTKNYDNETQLRHATN